MDFWRLFMDILLVLLAAFALGTMAQRLRQSAVVGCLLAGTLVGPFLVHGQAVISVAEFGVSLLLFSIGLEFSFTRLRSLGRMAMVGGGRQVVAELLAEGVAPEVIDLNPRAAAARTHDDLIFHTGDASHGEILDEAGVARAAVVVDEEDTVGRAIARAAVERLTLRREALGCALFGD